MILTVKDHAGDGDGKVVYQRPNVERNDRATQKQTDGEPS